MQQQKKPWYKSPWAWFILMFPIAAILGCINMIWIAAKSNDGTVVDDYAKQGEEVTKVVARDQAAARLGLNAHFTMDADRQTIHLVLNKPVGDVLRLQFVHPTRSELDQKVQLKAQSATDFIGKLPGSLGNARWGLDLADNANQWRLQGSFKPEQSLSAPLRPAGQ
ncbi:FixH family protein [Silvimonas soli]|uniref:FixH family protein n=1 Tax=Silvimonas soli TaxID=2980100 RepID=UPI0024B37AC8|nr:FixH family protein [Silvimonas soli]